MANTNRFSFGVVTVNHKGRTIPTTVGSRKYESVFGGLLSKNSFPNMIGNIPAGYSNRPELISNLFLDTPGLWWLICERNNIFDVFEQLNVQDRIYLPV
tara:strand:+ start:4841 stop:5137 length:297 start_codon:yes stop_codon:yes gene_type:complete